MIGLMACQSEDKNDQLPRIAITGLAIESSTFSPALTHMEAFHHKEKEAVFSYYPFLSEDSPQRKQAKWYPALYGHALPGGIVTHSAYDSLVSRTLEILKQNLPYDGLFLDIHGAMSVVGLDDPEADFIKKVRKLVGPACIISTCMDLHGNVSMKLAKETDLMTCFRMAPHEDELESKQRAVDNLLLRLEQKKGKPSYKAWVPVPILLAGEQTSTRIEPGKGLYGMVEPITRREGILDAAIWVGYAWADEPRNRAAVMVTGDDEEAVKKAAEELAMRFWELRKEFEFVAPTLPFEEAMKQAFESPKKPFLVSDMGDNPTAGGAGDVSWTLTEILKLPQMQSPKGKKLVYASIPGPDLVAKAVEKGVGQEVEGMVGAMVDDRFAPPLKIKGIVKAIKHGDIHAETEVVVQTGRALVIVTKRRKPYHKLKDFTDLNLTAEDMDILVVKIGYLVPELYELQKGWVMALTPGGVDQDLVRLGYKRLTRPIFPLDPEMEAPDLSARMIPLSHETL
ncbi:MAG: M81 family metallopeptidase [Bacteroidia bacterium]|nr:M81 family metallopeptidase [Bacteroidia bacterium]